MNDRMLRVLKELVVSLSDGVVDHGFEKAMLRSLYLLFRPSSISLSLCSEEEARGDIRLYTLSGGECREENISAESFSAKYHFSICDTFTRDTCPVRTAPGGITLICDTIRDVQCVVIMEDVEDAGCLFEENLLLLKSFIELSLDARELARSGLAGNEYGEDEEMAWSRHSVKTALASVRTAIEMLMSGELSVEEEDFMKRLAHQGVSELSRIVETIKRTLCHDRR